MEPVRVLADHVLQIASVLQRHQSHVCLAGYRLLRDHPTIVNVAGLGRFVGLAVEAWPRLEDSALAATVVGNARGCADTGTCETKEMLGFSDEFCKLLGFIKDDLGFF